MFSFVFVIIKKCIIDDLLEMKKNGIYVTLQFFSAVSAPLPP